jgi:enoyl-CoA hydratase/carnithine racemase
MSGTVLARVDGPSAELILNRPEVLNAADSAWVEDLHAALDELESTAQVRVVLVSGAGSSFCSGLDLDALASGQIQLGWFYRWEDALARIEKLEAVTIAGIRGHALGAGLQIALACDLRIASDDARLGLPAVKQGLVPGLGIYRLSHFVGLGRARRMILCGETLTAPEALEAGLLDWTAPAGEFDARAAALAAQFLEGSFTARRISKKLTLLALEAGPREFREHYLAYISQVLGSEELRDAMDRRRAKRP